MPVSSLFENEQAILAEFIKKNKYRFDDDLKEVIKTLLDLITRFPGAVNNFDDQELQDYLFKMAKRFHSRYKENYRAGAIRIEKDDIYFYRFASVSIIYRSMIFLYPFTLIGFVNYLNFVSQACNELEKIEGRDITLDDFLAVYFALLPKAKPKLGKWDIELLKALSKFDFSDKYYYNKMQSFLAKKRCYRLINLQVLNLLYTVNFPLINLIPYVHLSSSQTDIPPHMTPFIEYEYHPMTEKKQEYQVFRLFLIPEKLEDEFFPDLRELGTTGKCNEWYVCYNWNSLRQTQKGNWKWDLNLSSLEVRSDPDQGRFDLISGTSSGSTSPVKDQFIEFLEVVHKYYNVNTFDISTRTGINEWKVNEYRQRAVDEKIVMAYWSITQIGIDSIYQVCFKNVLVNQKLAKFLDSLPKVSAMKSDKFCRYMLFLPPAALRSLKSWLYRGEKNGDFEILCRNEFRLDYRAIRRGVNLVEVFEHLQG
ncbi:MAG: hypothetical protein ACFFD4_26740 [Candidatus Odinarchaeota archaeon]